MSIRLAPQTSPLSSDRPKRIEALLFDMDGVIVDSEPLHLLAYQEILGAYGIPYSEEDNREFLGRKDIVILEELNRRHKLMRQPEDLLVEKESILARLIREKAKARPGLRKVLTEGRGRRLAMAVASSATLPTIHLVVDTLAIRDFFDSLTSGDEVARGKPSPDVFLLAAARLRVPPSRCLVIEDTLAGVLAAKAAGMYVVAIPCEATRHQDHSAADDRLSSLGELDLARWAG